MNDTARKSGYPRIHTEELIRMLATNAVLGMYTHGGDPVMDRRVASAYETINEVPFDRSLAPPPGFVVPPVFMHGPPGRGKSAAAREGAKLAARALGMNFVDLNLADTSTYSPERNDYVFMTRILGGEISPVAIDGLPSKRKDEHGEYVEQVVDKVVHMAGRAGGAYLLLDDVSNMHPSIVGKLLGLLQNRQFGGVSLGNRMYLALTGNYGGGMDGALKAIDLGSAVGNRCSHYEVVDDVNNWLERHHARLAGLIRSGQEIRGRYPDVLGLFVKENPDVLQARPTGPNRAFCTPRSLDNLYFDLWRVLYQKSRGNPERLAGSGNEEVTRELDRLSMSYLGPEAAARFGPFVSNLFSGNYQLARNVMIAKTGLDLDKALGELREKLGEGVSQDERSRCVQVANLISDHLASCFIHHEKNHEEIQKVIARAGKAWSVFPDREPVIGALSLLMERVEPLANSDGSLDLDTLKKHSLTILRGLIQGGLKDSMNKLQWEDVINALSGSDKYGLYRHPDNLEEFREAAAVMTL